MTPYPLPAPCPICSGPVLYKGKGRRPTYCGPDCKAKADATSRPERRALPPWTREDYARQAAEFARIDNSHHPEMPETIALRLPRVSRWTKRREEVATVPDEWTMRQARSRDRDEAAKWLAEMHPEALHDFPLDIRA